MHENCIVCGSSKIKKYAHYYIEKGLLKCSSCGFVFMEKIPTNEELLKHYEKYAYEGNANCSPITIKSYNNLLDQFEKYRKLNRILDVGCGRGWFLIEAKKRGWEVFGTEFSEAAIDICKSNNIPIFEGKLDSKKFSSLEFDVITSFEVIEHINNPNEELQNIYSLLRTGGLFYCTTPNFDSILRYYLKSDYSIIDYPEHLSYYTEKTLKKVAVQNQFQVNKILTSGISISRLTNGSSNVTPRENKDESLRYKIERSRFLRFVKVAVNKILNITSTGSTLKGYFIK